MGHKPRGRVADLMIVGIAAANKLPVHHQSRRFPQA
jgi:hypothetical protein